MSKRKSITLPLSPSDREGRRRRSGQEELEELEEKEIPRLTKKPSPVVTPTLEMKMIFDDEYEDIIDIMKRDPNFVPFWRHPEDYPEIKDLRESGWKKTSEKHPRKIKHSKEYEDFSNGIVQFILTTKYPNVYIKRLQMEYMYGLNDDKIFILDRHIESINKTLTNDFIYNKQPDIYLVDVGVSYVTSFDKPELEGRHAQIIIINNLFKTIEFYDPSHDITNILYKNMDKVLKQEFRNKFLVFLFDYEWKSLSQTCPDVNFQKFEILEYLPEPFRTSGFCIMWSAFLIEVRIIYAEYSTKTIKRILNKAVLKMAGNTFYQDDQLINSFAKFMYEYVLFWAKKKNIKRRISI